MKLRSTVPAGLADAGLASLGTFVAGLVAVRYFDAVTLGAYSVYLRAYLLAAVIPTHLVLVPATVEILTQTQSQRIMGLGIMVRSAAPIAAGMAVLTGAVSLAFTNTLSNEQLVALTSTTAVTALLSPLQDQARRVLHLSGTSWRAAGVSLTFFLGIVAVTSTALLLDVDPAWIPLGSIAAANALSLFVASFWARNRSRIPVEGNYRVGHLARSGRWLVANALVPNGAAFAATAIVGILAGPAVLGYAEGARIVAQPVLVFSLGLAAVVSPRSMEAAQERRQGEARRLARLFDASVVAVGLVMVALVGFDWPGNVLARLLPTAYTIGGLAAVTIAANTINAAAQPTRAELIARRKEPQMTAVEMWANAAVLLVAATAATTQAFARPLGSLAAGAIRVPALRALTSKLYSVENSKEPA